MNLNFEIEFLILLKFVSKKFKEIFRKIQKQRF